MSRTIPLGVDDIWFTRGTWCSEQAEVRASKDLNIVSIGAIAPHKGQDILLKAFQLANVSGCVRLIGPEINHRYARELRDLASTLGNGKHVAFLGFLSQAETISALRDANVFALLSRLDLYALAVTEAMALGHAPIVSRSVGASEHVENGISGYIVEDNSPPHVADILEAIAADLPRHCRMGEKARRRAETLRWSRVAADYANLYRKIVRTARGIGG